MNDIILKALKTYFKTLKIFGYKDYENVNKLIFLIAIQELIDNDYNALLTEEDYRDINKALYGILGTDCMFLYPKCCKK